jgi:hypothetical protein
MEATRELIDQWVMVPLLDSSAANLRRLATTVSGRAR